MKKLRILELVEDWHPVVGGVTSVVSRMCDSISPYCEITVGATKPPKKNKNFIDTENYQVIRCQGYYSAITTNREALVDFDHKFRKEIEKNKYDVIHCNFPLSLYRYARRLRKKYNIPVIITVHGMFYQDIYQATKSKFLASIITKAILRKIRKADKVWTVSNFAKNFFEKFSVLKDCEVLPNAVKTPKDTTDSDVFEKFGIDENHFVIFSVCRLVKMKNIQLLIEAMKFLQDKPITLVIAGKGDDRQRLERLAKNLKNIKFIGAISEEDLNSFWRRVDLHAFVSIGDTCGLTQMECAYFSVPTLALENTAISEQIVDCKNGFITTNNPEACAEKIMFCYDNKELLKQCGQQAKLTLFKSYDQKEVIDNILLRYEQVIEEFNKKNIK